MTGLRIETGRGHHEFDCFRSTRAETVLLIVLSWASEHANRAA